MYMYAEGHTHTTVKSVSFFMPSCLYIYVYIYLCMQELV